MLVFVNDSVGQMCRITPPDNALTLCELQSNAVRIGNKPFNSFLMVGLLKKVNLMC